MWRRPSLAALAARPSRLLLWGLFALGSVRALDGLGRCCRVGGRLEAVFVLGCVVCLAAGAVGAAATATATRWPG